MALFKIFPASSWHHYRLSVQRK